jgi:putative acetyltransferase
MMNSNNFFIRLIEFSDSPGVQKLIQTVMPEFGATGPGFAINDKEVTDMYSSYQRPGHTYFVVTDGLEVYGGGGIAPLCVGEKDICELRKMYFKQEARGLGLGQGVMNLCLITAKELGYKQCYLETLKTMNQAQKLYVRNGFESLSSPLGNTGHFSCDKYYLKDL